MASCSRTCAWPSRRTTRPSSCCTTRAGCGSSAARIRWPSSLPPSRPGTPATCGSTTSRQQAKASSRPICAPSSTRSSSSPSGPGRRAPHLGRTLGPRRSRRCQQAVCQCLRSSTPRPPVSRAPSAGQATTCGVPGTISWSHPGQRYAFVDPAPGIRRTTQSPSGHDSTRSGPGTGSGGPERSRRIRRGLTPVKAIGPDAVELPNVRLVIARCSVDYVGRLTAHLPEALRLLIVKADGSVLVHSDGGSYKPLNWMSPPCRLTEEPGRWSVTNKAGETLAITITEVLSDTSVDLGVDPGLVKDGVEAHLQELLAVQLGLLGEGWRLVRREYPTPIDPVDLMCQNEAGESVAVEIKRRGEIDGSNFTEGTASGGGAHVAVEVKRHAGIDAVEQLTRYLELLNRDPLLRPVTGVLAAQTIRPQARTLAEDRGIRCVVLDYDAMRGIEREDTLF